MCVIWRYYGAFEISAVKLIFSIRNTFLFIDFGSENVLIEQFNSIYV